MTPSLGWLPRRFADRFFGSFGLAPEDAASLRGLERRGAVVYVMRYSSRLDYLLFNWLFLASRVRLSAFANGITFFYYRPLREAVPLAFRRIAHRVRHGRRALREEGFGHLRRIVRAGDSIFLFLRTDKIRTQVHTRRDALESGRREIDYLRELVDTAFVDEAPVALVPLVLFWRKGSQGGQRYRYLNVFYGGAGRPSDTGKVLSFLWNYRNLAIRVGTPIDLRGFVDERRAEGRDRVLRQVRRSLLIFLRREEKPVLGAALRPLDRIAEAVLADPPVREVIDAVAREERCSPARGEARARRILREIAARPSSSTLAVLDVLVTWIFRRLFARVEVKGLDRIVEAAKLHPLVLMPSHRSHFDYLILSWLFYERHLVPPLVAAGINLSFWPLGPVFRRAGGFFMRRSFDGDPLYTAVFRSYVQLLIKDGVTQEFFLEGTRSRTGKTLPPRLGMLRMVIDAFTRGVRSDVALVPIGFTYERLVEEHSMTEEKRGSRKRKENLLELVRARSVLRHRFGAVTIRFGEPISLAEVPGLARGVMPPAGHPDRDTRLRAVTADLGDVICRRLNGLATAGGSAVSAAALLGGGASGLRESEFRERVLEVVELLGVVGLPLSDGLADAVRDGRIAEAADLLQSSAFVERKMSGGESILHFEVGARDTLAYYRAAIAPALAWPGVLALALAPGGTRMRSAALSEASAWLDRLHLEYFPPSEAEREVLLGRVLEHLVARGWVRAAGGALVVEEDGRRWLEFLVAQIRPALEAYAAVLRAAASAEAPITRKDLLAAAASILEDRLILGEARHPEASCRTTQDNALALLLEHGVLRADGNPRQPDARLDRGEAFAALERWVDEIETALGA